MMVTLILFLDLLFTPGGPHMGINMWGMPSEEEQQQQYAQTAQPKSTADIIKSNYHELRLEKSNILLLGPTGSGKYKFVYLI